MAPDRQIPGMDANLIAERKQQVRGTFTWTSFYFQMIQSQRGGCREENARLATSSCGSPGLGLVPPPVALQIWAWFPDKRILCSDKGSQGPHSPALTHTRKDSGSRKVGRLNTKFSHGGLVLLGPQPALNTQLEAAASSRGF